MTTPIEVSLTCRCGACNLVAPLQEIIRLALAGLADRECAGCGQRQLDLTTKESKGTDK